MSIITLPPEEWQNQNANCNTIDILKKINDIYKDNDLLFKVIKDDGSIKFLSKKESFSKAYQLAKNIKSLSNKFEQIKLFGIISASEESVIFMIASLFLGAHHCICFEELTPTAIASRIDLFKPDFILYRPISKHKAEESLILIDNSNVELVEIVIDSLAYEKKQNISWEYICKYAPNDSLFTLFTSGSTGIPKAIVHGVNNYLEYSHFTSKYFFGLKKGSTIYTATDAGWINGHTYAFYGPLLAGAISVINECPLAISVPRFLSQYLCELKVDCFYSSVTLLRIIKSLCKKGQLIKDFYTWDRSIERIGSCGEPLAHDVGEWAISFFKPMRKSIVNTYFQTETGGVLTAPRDEDGNFNDLSCVGRPRKELNIFLAKDVLSKKEITDELLHPEELLVGNYFSGIFKEVISDRKTNYFTSAGYFRLNDVGFFDEKGYLYIGGRSDDVINVSGHRIASSEVESICLSIDQVKEACAVSRLNEISGCKVIVFISTTQCDASFKLRLKDSIKKKIILKLSSYHLPEEIYFFDSLPKTRSGKIIRRIMRTIANGNVLDTSQDFSTLLNKKEFLDSFSKFNIGD